MMSKSLPVCTISYDELDVSSHRAHFHLNRKLTFQGVGGVVLCLCIEGVANVRSTG